MSMSGTAGPVVIEDHHVAYVSRAEWDEAQQILAINAPAKARRNLGPGTALVQGIILCDLHSQSMCAVYRSRQQKLRSFHVYQCGGDYLNGGERCGPVPGPIVDRAVRDALLERLSPPPMQALRGQWREAKALEVNGERRLNLELNRARLAVDEAKHRALSVDPGLHGVAAELNLMWEEAKKRLRDLESGQELEVSAVDLFTDQAWDEALTLSQSIAAIWDAPSTEDRDRKELARIMIKTLIIEGRTREEIRARIVWNDGAPDQVLDIKLPPFAWKRMLSMADEGMMAGEIADRLNAMGLQTTQGTRWSKDYVQHSIRTMQKRGGVLDYTRKKGQ